VRNMKLSVICVAYKKYSEIQVLINCFESQTRGNWELVIIHDGYDDMFERTVRPYCWADPHRVKLHYSDERHNDWGHTNRDAGIDIVTGNWTLQTNDDNYYVPVFVEEVLDYAEACSNVNMIGWDMIHNYKEFGPYKFVDTNLSITGPTEMGAFACSTDMAREVRFAHRDRGADQGYIKDLIGTGRAVVGKVDKILFVHN